MLSAEGFSACALRFRAGLCFTVAGQKFSALGIWRLGEARKHCVAVLNKAGHGIKLTVALLKPPSSYLHSFYRSFALAMPYLEPPCPQLRDFVAWRKTVAAVLKDWAEAQHWCGSGLQALTRFIRAYAIRPYWLSRQRPVEWANDKAVCPPYTLCLGGCACAYLPYRLNPFTLHYQINTTLLYLC